MCLKAHISKILLLLINLFNTQHITKVEQQSMERTWQSSSADTKLFEDQGGHAPPPNIKIFKTMC